MNEYDNQVCQVYQLILHYDTKSFLIPTCQEQAILPKGLYVLLPFPEEVLKPTQLEVMGERSGCCPHKAGNIKKEGELTFIEGLLCQATYDFIKSPGRP